MGSGEVRSDNDICSLHTLAYLTVVVIVRWTRPRCISKCIRSTHVTVHNHTYEYSNERDTGEAIQEFLASPSNTSQLNREAIHYTSKLASNSDYNTARRSIKRSVKECGLGYIDLFLLHSPYGGKQARLESWRAVEDAILEGDVKIGGVSNYGVKHLEELLGSQPRIKPAVNQVEVRPSRRFRRRVTDKVSGTPIQYPNSHHVVLPAERNYCGSVRPACQSIKDEAPGYCQLE